MSFPEIGSPSSFPRLGDLVRALSDTGTEPSADVAADDAHAPSQADDEQSPFDFGFGGARPAAADAPTPTGALQQIDALPKPDFSDIPHNLPREDQQSIRDARTSVYNRQIAAIADDASEHAQPPKPSDFAALPPQLRRVAYQEALQSHQAQLSELHGRSLDAKQANLRLDPDFRQLPPQVQTQALDAMAANRGTPFDVDVIAEVVGSPAFLKLGAGDIDLPLIGPLHFDGAARKGQLLSLIGDTTPLSASARAELHTAIHGGVENKPDDNQVPVDLDDAGSLDRFVWTNARPADRWRDALPPSGVADDRRATYTVSSPETIDHYDFPSSTTPGEHDSKAALRYTVDVHGRSIEVVIPAPGSRDAGQSYPTIEQIARGLAAMTPEVAAQTERVIAVPLRAAEDRDGQIVPSGADMYASSGEITINPHDASAPRAQKDFDTTFLHEGAHLLTQPDQAEWNRAVAADQLFSTHYADDRYAPNAGIDPRTGADADPGEDFAETYMIYKLVQGTPDEAQMRALMPERFALLDTMYP